MPTESNTKVLLSFGAVQGGFEFAMQLRLDIYKKFNERSDANPYFCYLDAESLRTNQNTTYTYKANTDMNVMSNPDWEANYLTAMQSCKTMILLITRQWLRSKWCWKELDMLITEAAKSEKKLVVVYWPDARSLMEQGIWDERQEGGATHTPADLLERIGRIKSDKVEITCGAQTPFLGQVPGGDVNIFKYSCSEGECQNILATVVR